MDQGNTVVKIDGTNAEENDEKSNNLISCVDKRDSEISQLVKIDRFMKSSEHYLALLEDLV